LANSLYDHGRDLFANAGINWTSDTIRAILCTAAYTPNLATDQFLSVIPGGAIVSSGVLLASRSTNAGKCSANPVVFNGVTAGDVVTQMIIYKDTGVAGTSPLIGYVNVAVGLPAVSLGNAITCTFFGNEVFEL
jgi:hypothetical protein